MKTQILEKMAKLEKEMSQCDASEVAELAFQQEALYSYFHAYVNN